MVNKSTQRVGVHSKSRLLALPENIKLELKELTLTNTLAYYLVVVKSFMLQPLYLNYEKFYGISLGGPIVCCQFMQGILTKGEGSVQLTS